MEGQLVTYVEQADARQEGVFRRAWSSTGGKSAATRFQLLNGSVLDSEPSSASFQVALDSGILVEDLVRAGNKPTRRFAPATRRWKQGFYLALVLLLGLFVFLVFPRGKIVLQKGRGRWDRKRVIRTPSKDPTDASDAVNPHHSILADDLVDNSDYALMRDFGKGVPITTFNPGSLLVGATILAEGYIPEAQRKNWWINMGTYSDVRQQFEYTMDILKRESGIKTVCEIGFNAGHSAIAFLAAREDVDLTEFDSKALPYSVPSAHFIRNLFGKRFKIIWGLSMTTLPRFIEVKGRYCDLFSVDGQHSGVTPLVDLENAAKASKPGAYILMDDVSETFPDVLKAWTTATDTGIIREVECVDFGNKGPWHKRVCLGMVTK